MICQSYRLSELEGALKTNRSSLLIIQMRKLRPRKVTCSRSLRLQWSPDQKPGSACLLPWHHIAVNLEKLLENLIKAYDLWFRVGLRQPWVSPNQAQEMQSNRKFLEDRMPFLIHPSRSLHRSEEWAESSPRTSWLRVIRRKFLSGGTPSPLAMLRSQDSVGLISNTN